MSDPGSEYGRLLADRDRLIADGADPADLEVPIAPMSDQPVTEAGRELLTTAGNPYLRKKMLTTVLAIEAEAAKAAVDAERAWVAALKYPDETLRFEDGRRNTTGYEAGWNDALDEVLLTPEDNR